MQSDVYMKKLPKSADLWSGYNGEFQKTDGSAWKMKTKSLEDFVNARIRGDKRICTSARATCWLYNCWRTDA